MKIDLSDNEKPVNKKNEIKIFILSNEAVFLISCTFVAFLIRFSLLPPDPVIDFDGVYYARLGGRMISGDLIGGISAYWSPLYPFLIGVFSLFFQDLEFAGRFVSIIAGTALIFPSYFLIRDFFGRAAAYLGVILIIFHPSLIQVSGWVMTESVYILIFTTGILTSWLALKDRRNRDFFVTGLLFGAAYLTKPEAIGYIGLLLVLTMGAKLFRRDFPFRSLFAGYLLLLIGFSIFLIPYVTVIYQKTGRLTISQKIQFNIPSISSDMSGNRFEISADGQSTKTDQIYGDAYETENQKSKNSKELPSGNLAGATFDFKGFIPKILKNLNEAIKNHIPWILTTPLILLTIVGFFYKPWTRQRLAKEFYLFSFLICTLLGYAATITGLRYTYTIIPILLCWTSHGIVELSDWFSKSISNVCGKRVKINRFPIQIFILIAAVAFLATTFYYRVNINNEFWAPPFEEKRAGLWIKNHKTSPSLVMASSPIVSFYAEEKHIFLPNEELSKVIEYAKRKKVNYLFLSHPVMPRMVIPDENNLPPELKLVYSDEQTTGKKVFVYQLVY